MIILAWVAQTSQFMLLDRFWISLLYEQYDHTSHIRLPFERLILLSSNREVEIRLEHRRIIAKLRSRERRIYEVVGRVRRSVVLCDD